MARNSDSGQAGAVLAACLHNRLDDAAAQAVADPLELRLQVEELQQAVLALRDALEQSQRDAQRRNQEIVATAEAEKQQLRTTVEQLRLQLEEQVATSRAAQQQLKAEAAEEIRQLQDTVVAQRQQLDQHSHNQGQ